MRRRCETAVIRRAKDWSRAGRARPGMTLMELVIGLAITGMMAAAGAGAFASIIDHRHILRDATATTERAAALRDLIHTWAAAGTVQMQIGGGPRGLSSGAAGAGRGGGPSGMSLASVTPAQAGGDELRLTTSAFNPTMQANVTLRLYIDVDASTPEKGLTVEYQPNPQVPLARTMLDSTIDTLRVEYLDGRLNRWFPASQAATIGQVIGVRVTLIPNPKIPVSPIVSLPMIFTNGVEVRSTR